MHVIERLTNYYKQNPPRLSYGGSEGENMRGKVYLEWPKEEEVTNRGEVVVWLENIEASSDAPPIEGYCIVDVSLDPSGHKNPDALPLFPEMKGHALRIAVYVDSLDRIHMKAVGGFSSHGTRENAVI